MVDVPTKARLGFGASLSIKIGAGAFIKVGELTSVAEPSRTKDTVDATNMGSPNKYREFIAGLKDGGEIPLEGNRVADDAGQTALDTAFESDDAVDIQIDMPTSPAMRWTAKALVTARDGALPMDDKMTFSATAKITGKPTLAAVV